MAIKEMFKDKPAVSAASAKEWRKWLEKNHVNEPSVWLIMFKKATGVKSVTYNEAVDEALCFGWIDSVAYSRDEDSFYQYFTKRKPKSNWSAVNKLKIAALTEAGKMMPAGIAMVELAKKTGTWDGLNEVESLTVPDDLNKAFQKNKKAFKYWEAFPRSAKRAILEWINAAKQEETRKKRIAVTVQSAAENIRANQPKQPKK